MDIEFGLHDDVRCDVIRGKGNKIIQNRDVGWLGEMWGWAATQVNFLFFLFFHLFSYLLSYFQTSNSISSEVLKSRPYLNAQTNTNMK
jgi:hypothetical protein